jgi:hypothetical protein
MNRTNRADCRINSNCYGVLVVAAFAAAGSCANATPISLSTDGSQLDVASVSDSLGPPAALTVNAFDFFAYGNNGATAGNQVSTASVALADYATVTPVVTSYYGDNSYSHLTVDSATTNTGVIYSGGLEAGTIATITLASTVPSSFVLGILADSSNDAGNNTAYTITASNDGAASPGDEATLTVNNGFTYTGAHGAVSNGPPYSGQPAYDVMNDFFFVSVSNAAPGEVLTITGYAPNEQITLAGLTFTTAVPEPSALCGAAVFGMVAMARRRRAV